ncbi:MAG: hypothetical protein U5L02_07250 [Rheinheimera sp.]|nr:hypothetical protein [Rheinheimera sp.]
MSTIEKALDKMSMDDGNKPAKTAEAVVSEPLVAEQVIQTAEPTSTKPIIKLDTERLSKLNFVANAQERKLISEEYRVIKRKLINNAFGPLSSTIKNGNLILVTSTRHWRKGRRSLRSIWRLVLRLSRIKQYCWLMPMCCGQMYPEL